MKLTTAVAAATLLIPACSGLAIPAKLRRNPEPEPQVICINNICQAFQAGKTVTIRPTAAPVVTVNPPPVFTTVFTTVRPQPIAAPPPPQAPPAATKPLISPPVFFTPPAPRPPQPTVAPAPVPAPTPIRKTSLEVIPIPEPTPIRKTSLEVIPVPVIKTSLAVIPVPEPAPTSKTRLEVIPVAKPPKPTVSFASNLNLGPIAAPKPTTPGPTSPTFVPRPTEGLTFVSNINLGPLKPAATAAGRG